MFQLLTVRYISDFDQFQVYLGLGIKLKSGKWHKEIGGCVGVGKRVDIVNRQSWRIIYYLLAQKFIKLTCPMETKGNLFHYFFFSELTGVDLFLADLKALEVYFGYYYCLSRMWTKPLPATYDAEQVTEYFSLRPHVVAFRLLEVLNHFMQMQCMFIF